MDLTTQISTHVISTSTGKHYMLTHQQNEALKQASLDDMITTNSGVSVKCSMIAEVMDLETYYKTYPEKQTYNYGQPYEKVRSVDDIIISSPNAGLRFMAKGLQRFIDSQEKKGLPHEKADVLIEKMRMQFRKKNKQKEIA